ncbi:protein cholesin isoform 1-T3 [Mantella aurantiaca]
MAKNKTKSSEKNKTKSSEKKEKKKKMTISESILEVPKAKKMKLNPKVLEDPDSAASKEEDQDSLLIEDLTPEERRVLERKLKKERKKEEKRLKKESEGLAEEKNEPSKPSAAELALQYLMSWSKKHSEWKFQKTRQTWLLMNMYDQEKVPDKYFHIMLDYLGGLKGSARETTIQKAEDYMKQCDSEETREEEDSQKIQRIREVLQLLS